MDFQVGFFFCFTMGGFQIQKDELDLSDFH